MLMNEPLKYVWTFVTVASQRILWSSSLVGGDDANECKKKQKEAVESLSLEGHVVKKGWDLKKGRRESDFLGC